MSQRDFRIGSISGSFAPPDATGPHRLTSRRVWLDIALVTAALLAWASFACAQVLAEDYSPFKVAHLTRLAGTAHQVLASDLDGDGAPDLVLAEGGPDHVSVWWNDGHGDLESAPTLVGPGHVRGMAVIEVPGAGAHDIVWSDSTGLHRARVHPARTIEPVVDVITSTDIGPLCVLDADGDGAQDLLVGDDLGVVGLHGGPLGLGSPFRLAELPHRVMWLAGAPTSSQGLTDVVAAWNDCDSGGTPSSTLVRLRIDSGFRVAGIRDVTPPDSPDCVTGVILSDIDGDGRWDLAANSSQGLTLWWGDALGGYATAGRSWGAPHDAYEPISAVADMDADGHPDILVAAGSGHSNDGKQSLALYSGLGARSFGPAQIYDMFHPSEAGRGTRALAIADMDRDGRLDVIAIMGSWSGPELISIGYHGTGRELALPRVDPITVARVYTPVSAQVFTDAAGGRDAVLIADPDGARMVRLDPSGGLIETPVDGLRGPLLFSDIDGDGREDAVEIGDSVCTVHLALRGGGYGPGEPVAVPHLKCTARLDGGRDSWLVGMDPQAHPVIAERLPRGGYAIERLPRVTGLPGDDPASAGTVGIAAYPNGPGHRDELLIAGPDRTGEGYDLVRLAREPHEVWRERQRVAIPAPDLGAHMSWRLGEDPLAVTDMDADGRADVLVLVIGWDSGLLQAFHGDEDGRLAASGPYVWGNTEVPTSFLVTDMDADGHPDVLIGADFEGYMPRLVALFGDGRDGFERRASFYPATTGDFAVAAAADLDGDGTRDALAVENYSYGGDRSGALATFFGGIAPAPVHGHHVPGGRPSRAPSPAPTISAITPLPARDAFDVRFTLAGPSPARLELIDVTGRRVASHELDASASTTRFELGREIRSGVYWLRLTQGARVGTARVVVMR